MVHASLTGAPTGETPPFEILSGLVATLERAGVPCVLGGSGLLAALGLSDVVGDWDLTTDSALDDVLDATRDLPHELMGPNGIHADHKLRLEAGRVELIVRFAIVSDGATVRLPSLQHGSWRGVPVGSPEVWAAAYHLMDRPEKWSRLRDWLVEHGARREIVERLIEEPLPSELKDGLIALVR
jgi:hypothetical protein